MVGERTPIDPRWRVLFLLGAAIGVFFLRAPWMIGAALGVLVVLWFIVGLPATRLFRQIFKLWGFTLFVVASYALTKESPEIDRWVELPIGSFTLKLRFSG